MAGIDELPEGEDFRDEEFPDEESPVESAATVACGECGKAVYQEGDRCPHCGYYRIAAGPPARPAWWWVGWVIAFLVMVLLFGGLVMIF